MNRETVEIDEIIIIAHTKVEITTSVAEDLTTAEMTGATTKAGLERGTEIAMTDEHLQEIRGMMKEGVVQTVNVTTQDGMKGLSIEDQGQGATTTQKKNLAKPQKKEEL